MLNYLSLSIIGISLLLLAACSSHNTQGDTTQPNAPTPAQLIQQPDMLATGSSIRWGGRIVGIHNLKKGTILEILAFPLDRSGRPISNSTSRGRFMAEQPDYLEPLEYAPGRMVTVNGNFNGLRQGRVEEARYQFPLLMTKKLMLWPQQQPHTQRNKPRVNFGIGLGSGGYRGIGVGIGF